MGMNLASFKLALELKKKGILDSVNSIIDMGSADMRISYENIKFLFNQSKIDFDKKTFNFLKNFPKGKRRSTKIFWNALGLNNYECLDINSKNNSHKIDLNFPLAKSKLKKQYDLVNDFGNNEHVFNVGEAYKTMFKLTKKNGLIWIRQSVYNGNGFFNFDKSFFEGMAVANNLSILFSSYIVKLNLYDEYLIPCSKELLSSIDLNKVHGIDITYVFRKNKNQEFKYYYQYNLDNPNDTYEVQYLEYPHSSEKMYIKTKEKKEYIKLAKKGNKEAIEWLRALGISF